MARALISFDISKTPDLLRLVEEVAESGKPRILRRADEDVAVLLPVKKETSRPTPFRKKTKADYEAFLASAGGWADVDIDTFLKENAKSRRLSTRPPAKL
jgi:hypothetical protein